MTRRTLLHLSAGALLAPAKIFSTRKHLELLWERPSKLSPEAFAAGTGGVDGAPKAPFEFVEEDDWGTNPKIRVRDANGKLWVMKWGDEVHSEVFATRLVSAAGFYVRPVYYVAKGSIANVGKLGRAADRVDDAGNFEEASFKFLDDDLPYVDGHDWAWVNNPFRTGDPGLQHLNGLKLLMMLTSNWDGKDASNPGSGPNTAIYERKTSRPPALLYVIDDWGGSMGSWGNVFTRSKWNAADFERESPSLVESVTEGRIVWGFAGRHSEEIKSNLRPGDIAWFLSLLDYVTDEHLGQALEAAGADAEEKGAFLRALRIRFKELESVAG